MIGWRVENVKIFNKRQRKESQQQQLTLKTGLIYKFNKLKVHNKWQTNERTYERANVFLFAIEHKTSFSYACLGPQHQQHQQQQVSRRLDFVET